jgi:hypothetical protein
MMHIANVFVDLPENRCAMRRRWNIRVNTLLKREFRTRQHANGYFRIVRRAETASPSTEISGNKFLANFGWARHNVH